MRGKMFWAMKGRYFGCYSGFDIEKTKNHVGPSFIRKVCSDIRG
jgi:hypothetical protein